MFFFIKIFFKIFSFEEKPTEGLELVILLYTQY